MYFLDINTCIYFLNGKFKNIRDKILATPPNEIAIPVIVKAELLLGGSPFLSFFQEEIRCFFQSERLLDISRPFADRGHPGGQTLFCIRSVLKNGHARAIRFSTLERLCEALQCQPGDLIRYEIDTSERQDM